MLSYLATLILTASLAHASAPQCADVFTPQDPVTDLLRLRAKIESGTVNSDHFYEAFADRYEEAARLGLDLSRFDGVVRTELRASPREIREARARQQERTNPDLWTELTTKQIWWTPAHISLSPDGSQMIAQIARGRVALEEIHREGSQILYSDLEAPVQQLKVDWKNQRLMLFPIDQRQPVLVYDWAKQKTLMSTTLYRSGTPIGDEIAFLGPNRTVLLFDPTTTRAPRSLALPASGIEYQGLRAFGQQQYLFMTTTLKAVTLDIRSGETRETRAMSLHALDPNEPRIAMSSTDGTLKIHYPFTPERDFTISKTAFGLNALEFSRDGRYLFASNNDPVLRTFKVLEGGELAPRTLVNSAVGQIVTADSTMAFTYNRYGKLIIPIFQTPTSR